MRKKLGVLCVVLGALLILAAAGLAVYNQIEAEHAAEAADDMLVQIKGAIGQTDTNKQPENTESSEQNDEMPVVEIDGYEYIGYLSIPSLDLELPVMADWDYTRLKISPCRYYGSVRTDNFVIAAHNYDRHFGRLSKLKTGDIVKFTDMEGTDYTYRVADIETLPPTAVEEMISGGWPLSLYTCTYSGQARVTVRCDWADG